MLTLQKDGNRICVNFGEWEEKTINDLKKEITLYTVIAAAVAEAISLPFLGLNIVFPYGLAIGVCAAVINLSIISTSIEKAVAVNKRAPVIIGFVVRVLLYAGALLLAINASTISCLGAAIGMLLPRVVMYIRYAIRPAIRKWLGREPKAVYVTDTSSLMFIKEPSIVRHAGGKAYMTHRHYRKKRKEINS